MAGKGNFQINGIKNFIRLIHLMVISLIKSSQIESMFFIIGGFRLADDSFTGVSKILIPIFAKKCNAQKS
jgi:hypothetical protein